MGKDKDDLINYHDQSKKLADYKFECDPESNKSTLITYNPTRARAQ